VARADFVITTDATFADTDRQVEEIYHRLQAAGSTNGHS
jgi:dephospho-CoA kinase